MTQKQLIRLKEEGISLKQQMGQNLLVDKDLAQRIVDYSAIKKNDLVVEIGPGLGALTYLLSQRAKDLHVIEKDRRLIPLLQELMKGQTNIIYHLGDALKFQYSLFPAGTTLIGNLPYNISTPLLRLLLPFRDYFSSMTFMLQREVAQRIVSSPAIKEYGILTLFVQYYAKASILEEISPEVFYPKPGVVSALIKFLPLKDPPVKVEDEEFFFQVIRASFQQRRKKLINSLSHNIGLKKERLQGIMERIPIHPDLRGERLTLSDFATLSNHLLQEGLKTRERR